MIRRIGLWATVAATGVFAMSSAALTADMPVKAPPPPPVVTTPQYYLVLSGLVMTRTGPDATPLWSTAAAPGSGNLLNSSAFNFGWAGGFEGRAGVRLANRFGLEAGGFWLGKLDDQATLLNPTGVGVRVETNPFTSYGFGANDRVEIPYTSRIWSVEGNATWEARPGVTLLAGIRYISLRERLEQNGIFPIAGSVENDVWNTRNSLIGAQVGARVDVLALAGNAAGPWLLHGDLRFGVFHNEVKTDFVASASPVPGVFHTNSGGGSRTAWAAQGGLNLGYRLNDTATIKVGYEFLYIDGVALAPNQIPETPDYGSGPTPLRPIGARFEDVLYHGVKGTLVIRR
jgi:hypothetical protein